MILGNHEYVGFPNVDAAVAFYKGILNPMGYRVLQNELFETNKIIVYGGTGFAKYNERYNSNNLVNCDAMTGNRAYEIAQTTLFEKGYNEAKNIAQKTGKCFICAAHYPVEDCLGKFDREAIFFTGHTHKNERVRSENIVLYADNQIGYHNDCEFDGKIQFKFATTDYIRNPYECFEDGFYLTTPSDYHCFCDYIGEYIGEGKLIQARCENGAFYVIKSRGYYGFFIINKRGLSIVDGGKTKRIALNQSIEWAYEHFNSVVTKYCTALVSMRTVQVQISRELKRLGFKGTIHGIIVDINFENHILVNPQDGSITFYYSPDFGLVQQFESFSQQLEFMGRSALLKDVSAEQKKNAVALYDSNTSIRVDNHGIIGDLNSVSRRTGAYGVSRAICPLQRIFTGHVLRDFDLRLIEDENLLVRKRKMSWVGRIFCDKDSMEYLVIQDDLGELVTLMDLDGKKHKMSVARIKSMCSGSELLRACWVTLNITETVKNEIEEMPQVWKHELYSLFPGLIEGED